MTPLAALLGELRRSRGIRQKDLACLLEVDASYLSGLESGRKGPPTPALADRLRQQLALTEKEQGSLLAAIRFSQRRYDVPFEADPREHELIWTIMNSVGRLRPAQINAISEILKL